MPDDELEEFFKDEDPKKIQYYGPHGISDSQESRETRFPLEHCVRVNVRYWPEDTRIGIPNDMDTYVKTTMIQRLGSQGWELIEYRENGYLITTFAMNDDVHRMLSFLQPTRKVEEGVCLIATLCEMDIDCEESEDSRGNYTVENLILSEETYMQMLLDNLTRIGENCVQEPSSQMNCTFTSCECSDEKTQKTSSEKALMNATSAGRISRSKPEDGMCAAESRAVLMTKGILPQRGQGKKKGAANTCMEQIDHVVIEEKAELIAHGTSYLSTESLRGPPQFIGLFNEVTTILPFVNESIICDIGLNCVSAGIVCFNEDMCQ